MPRNNKNASEDNIRNTEFNWDVEFVKCVKRSNIDVIM